MNLKDTVRKQQDNWLIRLDGRWHKELECEFCNYAGARVDAGNCRTRCLIRKVLEKTCVRLPSWDEWCGTTTTQKRREAASHVLKDINKIARFYHLKQVEIPKVKK